MTKDFCRHIVYSTDFLSIGSPAFRGCIVHLLCKAGTAHFTYNGRDFSIEPHDIIVISRPDAVARLSTGDGFSCEFIAAPGHLLHSLLPANNYSLSGCVSLYANPVIKVSGKDAQTFSRDLDNIRMRMGENSHRFYEEMIGSLLQTMIYDLFDFHSSSNEDILATDRVGYISRRFFMLIEGGRPKTHREVAYYASRLNVTPKYLSETIRRVSGESVSKHINRAAAAIIREYLNDDRLSITQIADEMNFTSVNYFSRYCQKNLGKSPSEYRTVNSAR